MGVTLKIADSALESFAEQVASILAARIVPSQSPWLTVDEAADYLRWPKSRVQKLTAARAIPHVKHDGRVLFNRVELDAWLREFHGGPQTDS